MPINKNEITKEMLEKAMQCKDADELMAVAKAGGIELTKEEAEAYMAELAEVDLADKDLKNVSGGGLCPLIEYATIYHSNLFNSRGASASTAVVLVWKNAVLLSK